MKSKKKSTPPPEAASVPAEPKPKKVKDKKKPKNEKKKKEEHSQNILLHEPSVVMRPTSANINPRGTGHTVAPNRRKAVNPVTKQATKFVKAIKGELNDGGTCVKYMLCFYCFFVLVCLTLFF